ncbi:hypothetical protein TELCIR_19569, partial [Teladorsagia circumcincta]
METKMLRWTAGATRMDHIQNDAIRKRFVVAPTVDKLLSSLVDLQDRMIDLFPPKPQCVAGKDQTLQLPFLELAVLLLFAAPSGRVVKAVSDAFLHPRRIGSWGYPPGKI